MEAVWTELTKKRRANYKPTKAFAHSQPLPEALRHTIAARDPEGRHFTLLEIFFEDIVTWGLYCISDEDGVPSLAIAEQRDAFRAQANRLDSDANLVRWMSRKRSDTSRGREELAKLIDRMQRASEAYALLTGLLRGGYFDIDRIVEFRFAIKIADSLRKSFGFSMYGLVATITNVTLERDLKPTIIREWCRGPWGKRPLGGPG